MPIENLNILLKGIVMESPHSSIVFKRLLVFISNERSLLLFSEGVHSKAKNPLNKFAFSTVFNFVLLDERIGHIEGFLMLFRRLLEIVQ